MWRCACLPPQCAYRPVRGVPGYHGHSGPPAERRAATPRMRVETSRPHRDRQQRRPAQSRHTDGSGDADVYLPGPCTGR
jgi:hypothetical protein